MNNLPVTVQAIADTSRAAKSLENLTRKREVILAASFDARSIAAANKPLGAIKRSADEFEKSMAAANARVLAFGTSVAVIEGMRRSFLALIKTTAEVEKSLTQIKVVANDELKAAGLSIEKVGSQIFDLAKKTGQSFDATSKSFLEFARQGLKPAQTLERTKTALELVRISGAEQEKVIGGLTAAYNAFSSSGLTFTKIAEKLVNVDNKTTTSVEGLVDVLSRASSTAKLTGTSFEELLAVTATLKDITARSESVIGNAYRSISARLIDPKVLENLEELGIRTREFDGGPLLKTIGILTNVGEKLKEISDPSLQTEIVKSISGLYQFDQLTALISALQDVNNLQGFYQKNLRASKEDSDALNKANEAFSATLINKFNAVDVTIQQVLNSLGKIGIKNPLAGLLDSLVEIGEGFTNFIDGDSFGSDIARGFVKGFGGVLLGPTGVVTVGFIIAKIIKDFGVFAFDAAKSFLSLNKTAKDQELIQKSILTTISQMPSILNGIENTESGRLLLAQRVSAEYERQLSLAATLNNIAKGAAQSVYGQGFRITDSGLTRSKRASRGYLPNLISSEMRDVKNGVGGANPNSKIVVMPNFPFGGGKKGLMVANSSEVAMKMGDGYGILNPDMMGKRAAEGDFPSSLSLANTAVALKSGKFAPIKRIESALNQTISNFLDLGNGTKGLYQEIQKTLKDFKLTGETFKEVSVAANSYAKELVRNKEAAKKAYEQQIVLNNQKKQEEIEAARLQKLRQESIQKAGAYASSMATPAALSAIPYMGLGFMGSTSPKSSSSFGSFAPSSELLARLALLSKDSSLIYGDVGKGGSSYRGSNLDSPVDVFGVNPKNKQAFESSSIYGNVGRVNTSFSGGNLNNPIDVFGVNPIKDLPQTIEKTKGSLESFAIKTFAASAIVDIVGAQFRGASETTDKLIDAFSRATLAVAGFSFLSQRGGINFGKAFDSIGGFIGGLGKKAGGGVIGKAVGTTSSGISSAVGAISVFGRGLLSVVPILGQIGLAGFVINEFSKVFSDKSIFDRIYQSFGGLSDSAEKAKDKFNEVAAQIFDPSGQYIGRSLEERRGSLTQTRASAIQNLRAQSRGISTSGKNPQEVEAEILKTLLSGSVSNVKTGKKLNAPFPLGQFFGYDQTVALLSDSAQEQIIQVLQEVTTGTLDELKDLASSKGIKEIGGIPTAEASRENIQKALARAFVEQFIRERVGKNFDLESVLEGEVGKARLAGAALNFAGANRASQGGVNQTSSGFLSSASGLIPEGFFGQGKTLDPETQQFYLERAKDISLIMLEDAANSLESRIKSLDLESRDEGLTAAARNAKERQKAELEKQVLDIGQSRRAIEISAQRELIKLDEKLNPEQKLIEFSKLDAELKNLTNSTTREKKAVDDNVNSITKVTSALDKFDAALSGIGTALSFVGLNDARSESKISLLQARANNPSLSIGAQESLQRQINQESINRLQTSGVQGAALRFSEAGLQAQKLPKGSQQRIDAEKQAAAAYATEIEAIQGQINALNESTAQIGSVKSSFTSLNDAITQFVRNLGESRGQNQFNLLQATDANSIVQGLIGERVYDSSGGKGGAELVSFIADQNALLNEQFKIKTASNASERLELERQLELTTQLLEIKNKNLTPAQKQLEIEQAINANLAKRRTFSSGVKDALAEIETRSQNASNEFGKTATNAFRDGLSDAIKAAANGTGDLKNALLDVALAFANKLRDAAIDNLVDSLMSSGKGGGNNSGNIVGNALGFIGGFFQKKATGGMVRGGSGTKDDVPTLLTGGEYVIPKDVVNTYGKTFFDQIRSGTVGKMAQGGYFSPGMRGQGAIVGKENLLDFATQTATSGSQDVRQTLRGGAGLVSLEPESVRSSNFMRFGDSPILQSIREDKDQAFGLYLDQLGQEKQWLQDIEDAKRAEKERKKAITRALIMAVVSAAVGSYTSGMGSKTSGGEKAFSGGKIYKTSDINKYGTTSSSLGRSFSSSSLSSSRGLSLPSSSPSFSPQFDWREMIRQITANVANGGSGFFQQYNLGTNRQSGASLLLPSTSYTPYRNSGGYGNGDTKPAMLSSKEFVLNSSASQKLGDKALYALNSGNMPTGQSDDSAIIAKLDELIQKTAESAGEINITVNSSGDSEQSNTQSSDASERNKMIGERLKTAVLQILREEKRSGGELSNRR